MLRGLSRHCSLFLRIVEPQMVEASKEGFSLAGTLQASLDHVVIVLQIYPIITIWFGRRPAASWKGTVRKSISIFRGRLSPRRESASARSSSIVDLKAPQCRQYRGILGRSDIGLFCRSWWNTVLGATCGRRCNFAEP